jgi:hypothetical protein
MLDQITTCVAQSGRQGKRRPPSDRVCGPHTPRSDSGSGAAFQRWKAQLPDHTICSAHVDSSRLMKKSRYIQLVAALSASDVLHLVVRRSFPTPC